MTTRRDAALAARTWQEWQAAQPAASRYGAPVQPVPWALNWWANPDAPVPPDMVMVVCLCGVTLRRDPRWRGRTERGTPVMPNPTVGDPCDVCEAPYVRALFRDDVYVILQTDLPARPRRGRRPLRLVPPPSDLAQEGHRHDHHRR